jgi:hypothetical protein
MPRYPSRRRDRIGWHPGTAIGRDTREPNSLGDATERCLRIDGKGRLLNLSCGCPERPELLDLRPKHTVRRDPPRERRPFSGPHLIAQIPRNGLEHRPRKLSVRCRICRLHRVVIGHQVLGM